jgi:VanZ family protein
MVTASLKESKYVRSVAYDRLIKLICFCIVGTMLVAGLWPFHSPLNRARWLRDGNGLEFSQNSAIRSAESFHNVGGHSGESLEIWLEPSSSLDTNTILSFDNSKHAARSFFLRQYKDELIAVIPYVDDMGAARMRELAVVRAATGKTSMFVTITIGERDVTFYLNGVLKARFEKAATSVDNLTGRLVVGDEPAGRGSWQGKVLGLAMYRSLLSPEEVMAHYTGWTTRGQPTISGDESPFALYTFDEGSGQVVHNKVISASNLIIPRRYFALHPIFLASVADDYHPLWGYWQDVLVNVTGFIPLGICFFILWSEVWAVSSPILWTMLTGFLLSFTIEGLQVFLPTRHSSTTDLITNTVGTAIGILICHISLAQRVLSWLREGFEIGREPGQRVVRSHETASPALMRPSESEKISA